MKILGNDIPDALIDDLRAWMSQQRNGFMSADLRMNAPLLDKTGALANIKWGADELANRLCQSEQKAGRIELRGRRWWPVSADIDMAGDPCAIAEAIVTKHAGTAIAQRPALVTAIADALRAQRADAANPASTNSTAR